MSRRLGIAAVAALVIALLAAVPMGPSIIRIPLSLLSFPGLYAMTMLAEHSRSFAVVYGLMVAVNWAVYFTIIFAWLTLRRAGATRLRPPVPRA